MERQLEIVREALNLLSRVVSATAAAIPDLPRIVGFRNVLIHGYASVDNRIAWGVIEANLGSPCQTRWPYLRNRERRA